MAILSNVLGFAAFGLGTRMFQLGLQKRPLASGQSSPGAPLPWNLSADGLWSRLWLILSLMLFHLTGPAAYAVAAAAFGAFGYWADGVEHRQIEMIHEKEAMLRERRQSVGHGPLPAISSHSSKS